MVAVCRPSSALPISLSPSLYVCAAAQPVNTGTYQQKDIQAHRQTDSHLPGSAQTEIKSSAVTQRQFTTVRLSAVSTAIRVSEGGTHAGPRPASSVPLQRTFERFDSDQRTRPVVGLKKDINNMLACFSVNSETMSTSGHRYYEKFL